MNVLTKKHLSGQFSGSEDSVKASGSAITAQNSPDIGSSESPLKNLKDFLKVEIPCSRLSKTCKRSHSSQKCPKTAKNQERGKVGLFRIRGIDSPSKPLKTSKLAPRRRIQRKKKLLTTLERQGKGFRLVAQRALKTEASDETTSTGIGGGLLQGPVLPRGVSQITLARKSSSGSSQQLKPKKSPKKARKFILKQNLRSISRNHQPKAPERYKEDSLLLSPQLKPRKPVNQKFTLNLSSAAVSRPRERRFTIFTYNGAVTGKTKGFFKATKRKPAKMLDQVRKDSQMSWMATTSTMTSILKKKCYEKPCAFFEENNIASDSMRLIAKPRLTSGCHLLDEDSSASSDSEESVSRIEILQDEDYLTKHRSTGVSAL